MYAGWLMVKVIEYMAMCDAQSSGKELYIYFN
jgi:hypothetical protein